MALSARHAARFRYTALTSLEPLLPRPPRNPAPCLADGYVCGTPAVMPSELPVVQNSSPIRRRSLPALLFAVPYSASAPQVEIPQNANAKTTEKSSKERAPAPLLDRLIDDLAGRLVIFYGSPERAPAEALANEESMQKLLRFTDDVSPPMTEYPAAAIQRLEFHLAPEQEGANGRRVVLELRTTGGNCQRMVEQSLQAFFKECGLPSEFEWPQDAWALAEPVPIKTRPFQPTAAAQRAPEGASAQASAAAPPSDPALSSDPGSPGGEADGGPTSGGEARGAAGGGWGGVHEDKHAAARSGESSSSRRAAGRTSLGEAEAGSALPSSWTPDEASDQVDPHREDGPAMKAVVAQLDGALEAIASLPWHSGDGDRRRIQEQLVGPLEEDGWRVQEACIHIWAGERELDRLRLGLDGGSVQLVERILGHTNKFEAAYGRRHANMGALHSLKKSR